MPVIGLCKLRAGGATLRSLRQADPPVRSSARSWRPWPPPWRKSTGRAAPTPPLLPPSTPRRFCGGRCRSWGSAGGCWLQGPASVSGSESACRRGWHAGAEAGNTKSPPIIMISRILSTEPERTQERPYLRRRQIKHTIPEPKNQRCNRQHRCSKGGPPTRFDKAICKRRNEVERTSGAQELPRRGQQVRQTPTSSTARPLWPRSVSGSSHDQLASRISTRSSSSSAMPSHCGPRSHRLRAASRISAGSSGRCNNTSR